MAENETIYLQWKLDLIVRSACHQVQATVQHIKAGQAHFFRRDPISEKGDKEEFPEDGTSVHILNKYITIAHMYMPHRDSTSTHYKTVGMDIQDCIHPTYHTQSSSEMLSHIPLYGTRTLMTTEDNLYHMVASCILDQH